MPSGPPICALRASGRRTSGNGCTGWPTPKETDSDKGVRTMRGAELELARKGPGSDLPTMAAAAGWPTPDASALNVGGDLTTHEARRARLAEKWNNGNGAGLALGMASRLYAGQAHGTAPSGSSAGTAKPGASPRLNPAFVRWLMAYPAAWDACAPMATRSSHRSRRPSSGPILTPANPDA
jgi:hypothetical protein